MEKDSTYRYFLNGGFIPTFSFASRTEYDVDILIAESFFNYKINTEHRKKIPKFARDQIRVNF